VDVLKFDREFLLSSTNENGELDRKTAKFIQILIELSKHLEKETVFEGVETEAQRDFLKSVNCDQAQGFFYSKPLSEQDFLQFAKMHM
jgi:EAL domain-containing protein (putative c-di-GMP-specific phosphodiesterase class I)